MSDFEKMFRVCLFCTFLSKWVGCGSSQGSGVKITRPEPGYDRVNKVTRMLNGSNIYLGYGIRSNMLTNLGLSYLG